MALTLSQRARIRYVIDYLNAGSAGNIDSFSIEQLARIFNGTCSFACGCPGDFVLGMQNSPAATLLKTILCLDTGVLSAEDVTRIQWVIDYLDSGSAGAIDATAIEQLAMVFNDTCSFPCACPGLFTLGMQNSMAATLLTALLCVDSGSLTPGFDPG